MFDGLLRAVPDRDLDDILSGVSRSFYLSLAILPRPVGTQISVAYLVARAADTIADTHAVRPERRRSLLDGLRGAVGDPRQARSIAEAVRRQCLLDGGATQVPAERVLLERLADCLTILGRASADDRARIRKVLDALITGMERDLSRFPPTSPGDAPRALATMEELDEHCYLAAGCVGEFWTGMTAAHLPAVAHLARPDLVARGVRLGKALQLVNVIRDAPADLREGRCYLPLPLLARFGVVPADLIERARRGSARPAIAELIRLALAHVEGAWPYVEAIPRSAPRLRLACVWPLWIGLATLARLAALPDPLDPASAVKIPRVEVYRILIESSATVSIDRWLARAHARRCAAVEHAM